MYYWRRAALGAQRLDREDPEWFRQVDQSKLSIAHFIHCILGQLYGDYLKGRKALGLSYSEAVAHGFQFRLRDLLFLPVAIIMLNRAWRWEIQKREWMTEAAVARTV